MFEELIDRVKTEEAHNALRFLGELTREYIYESRIAEGKDPDPENSTMLRLLMANREQLTNPALSPEEMEAAIAELRRQAKKEAARVYRLEAER